MAENFSKSSPYVQPRATVVLDGRGQGRWISSNESTLAGSRMPLSLSNPAISMKDDDHNGNGSNGHNGNGNGYNNGANGHNADGNGHNSNGQNSSYLSREHKGSNHYMTTGLENLARQYYDGLSLPSGNADEEEFKKKYLDARSLKDWHPTYENGKDGRSDISTFFAEVGYNLMREYEGHVYAAQIDPNKKIDSKTGQSVGIIRCLEINRDLEDLASIAVAKGDNYSATHLHLEIAKNCMNILRTTSYQVLSAQGEVADVRENVVSQTKWLLENSLSKQRVRRDRILDTLKTVINNEENFDQDIIYPLVEIGLNRIEGKLGKAKLESGIGEFARAINRACQEKAQKSCEMGDRQGVMQSLEMNTTLLMELYGIGSERTKNLAGTMYSDSKEIADLDAELSDELIHYAQGIAQDIVEYKYGQTIDDDQYDKMFAELFFYYLQKKVNRYEFQENYREDSEELTLAKFALLKQIAVYMVGQGVISDESIKLIDNTIQFPVSELRSANKIEVAKHYYEEVARAALKSDIDSRDHRIEVATSRFYSEASAVFLEKKCSEIENHIYQPINTTDSKGNSIGKKFEGYNYLVEAFSALDQEIFSQEEVSRIAREAAISIDFVAKQGSIERVRLQTVLMNRVAAQVQSFERREMDIKVRNAERREFVASRLKAISQIVRGPERLKALNTVLTGGGIYQEKSPAYQNLYAQLLEEIEVLNCEIEKYNERSHDLVDGVDTNVGIVKGSIRDLVNATRVAYSGLVDEEVFAERVLLLVAKYDKTRFEEMTQTIHFDDYKSTIYRTYLDFYKADPRTITGVNLFELKEKLKKFSDIQAELEERKEKLTMGDGEFIQLCYERYNYLSEYLKERNRSSYPYIVNLEREQLVDVDLWKESERIDSEKVYQDPLFVSV